MKQVNAVFEERNYSLFKDFNGNRNVNKIHLKRLQKSMEEEYLKIPIIVNENYEIIDGQHRYLACKELKLPIFFIKIKGYGLKQIQRINSNVKQWSFNDYLSTYADEELPEYIKVRKFINKYEFGQNESLAMLLGYTNLTNENIRKKFEAGEFKIKDLKEAERKAEMLTMIKTFYSGYKRRSFVVAMLSLLDNKLFDFYLFLKKLKFQSTKLIDCTTKEQYLIIIESIYNYKTSEKVRLF